MVNLAEILGNQAFINFISTFGMAAFLVLYFVLYRDPKRDDYWKSKYDELTNNYNTLSKNYNSLEKDLNETWHKQYKSLNDQYDGLKEINESLKENYVNMEHDLRPEKRMMSKSQITKLAHLGLDRDLYKLFYYICAKLDGRRVEDLNTFVADSIRDTNETWSNFRSPFPKVPRIGDLYGYYKNNGGNLKVQLEEIMNSEGTEQEKKDKIWNKLLGDIVNMKREFDEYVHKLDIEEGESIKEYQYSEIS